MVNSCNSNYSYNRDYYYSPRSNCDGDIIGSIWNVNYNCDQNNHAGLMGGLGVGAGVGLANAIKTLFGTFFSNGNTQGGFSNFFNTNNAWGTNSGSLNFGGFANNFSWEGFNNNIHSLSSNISWGSCPKVKTEEKKKEGSKETESTDDSKTS